MRKVDLKIQVGKIYMDRIGNEETIKREMDNGKFESVNGEVFTPDGKCHVTYEYDLIKEII